MLVHSPSLSFECCAWPPAGLPGSSRLHRTDIAALDVVFLQRAVDVEHLVLERGLAHGQPRDAAGRLDQHVAIVSQRDLLDVPSGSQRRE